MKSVLITGVAGFIGSALADRFIEDGFKVFGVDDLSVGDLRNVNQGVNLLVGDLSDAAVVDKLPRRMGLILHLAGQSSAEISFDNPVLDLRKNIVTTINLLRYARENYTTRFVLASSMAVYGNAGTSPVAEDFKPSPLSYYGVSKIAAEKYLRLPSNNFQCVSLRMSNVYGPRQNLDNMRQGMVSIYVAQALSDGVIRVRGDLDRFRDFVYIDDVVDAWHKVSINEGEISGEFNLGSGVKTTVRTLIQLIKGCLPKSKVYIESGTPGDQYGVYPSISNLEKIIGKVYKTRLEDGIGSFIEWASKKRGFI